MIYQNSSKPFQKNKVRGRLVIVVYTANRIKLFANYIFFGIYSRFVSLNTLCMFCIFIFLVH